MARWLMKSEPFKYSFDDLIRDGTTKWDGVRNHLAKIHLLAMRPRDEVLFYHSNEGKAVIGTAKITKVAEPDVTVAADALKKDGSNPWVVVTVAPVRKLKTPVTLDMVRQAPALQEMALLKYSRLSVQPVTDAEWDVVMRLGGCEPDWAGVTLPLPKMGRMR